MHDISLINNMEEFLEYTQIISLLKEQLEYIKSPKTSDDIRKTIELMFKSDMAKLMVISSHSVLLGFVFFNINIGLQSSGKYLWINEMHVHKSYRGKGYGTILFEALKDWAKENNILNIMGIVDDFDERTRNFYLKQDTHIHPEEVFSLKL